MEKRALLRRVSSLNLLRSKIEKLGRPVPYHYLVVGVVVAFSIFWLVSKNIRNEKAISSPRYLVAKRDLPAGYIPRFADLSLAGDLQGVGGDVLTDQELSLLQGMVLKKSMVAGEPVSRGALEPAQKVFAIPRGLRGYGLFGEFGIHLRAGDRIDILLGARVIAENVLVLQSSKQQEDKTSVFVAIASDEVMELERRSPGDRVGVLLRSSFEQASTKTQKRDSKKRSQPSIKLVHEK